MEVRKLEIEFHTSGNDFIVHCQVFVHYLIRVKTYLELSRAFKSPASRVHIIISVARVARNTVLRKKEFALS